MANNWCNRKENWAWLLDRAYSQKHLSAASKSLKVINAKPFLRPVSLSVNVSIFSTGPNWEKKVWISCSVTLSLRPPRNILLLVAFLDCCYNKIINLTRMNLTCTSAKMKSRLLLTVIINKSERSLPLEHSLVLSVLYRLFCHR